MKRYYEFVEEFHIGEYEISKHRITSTDYDIRCHRETRMYEEDTFWMEEQSEVYDSIQEKRLRRSCPSI